MGLGGFAEILRFFVFFCVLFVKNLCDRFFFFFFFEQVPIFLFSKKEKALIMSN
jgi:hypothetical protein